MKKHGALNGVAITLGVVIVAVALAACGASSSTKSASTSSASSKRAKLEACLKSHGVTLPSRGFAGGGGAPPSGGGAPAAGGSGTPPAGASGTPPTGAGGGYPGAGGGGFFHRSAKEQAAFKACGADFGGGHFAGGRGHFTPHFSTAALDKFTSCVRKHGYDLPKPNTSSKSIFPKSAEHNKKFLKAYADCRSDLFTGFHPGAGAPGGGGGTPGTSGSSGTT